MITCFWQKRIALPAAVLLMCVSRKAAIPKIKICINCLKQYTRLRTDLQIATHYSFLNWFIRRLFKVNLSIKVSKTLTV